LSFKLEEQGDKYSLLTIEVLRRVLKMRPEEPQSALFLALALIRNSNKLLAKNELGEHGDLTGVLPLPTEEGEEVDIEAVAKKNYKEAIKLLKDVVLRKWDARFVQVEIVAIMEMCRLAKFVTFHGYSHELLQDVDGRLLAPIELDLRVVAVWDTDMTDVELMVEEPSGEKCYSFNNKTASGGMMSRNFTHGYGPQEYLVRNALEGTYKISVKLFSSMSKYTGTTISVKIFAHFGDAKKEQEKVFSLRLQKDSQTQQVAEVTFS